MKKQFLYKALYALPVIALFTGCAKEDLVPSEPKVVVDTTSELVDYVPVYEGRTGILVSINNYSYENQNGLTVEHITGSAKAVFPDESGNLRTAGNVQVQNVSLSASVNNAYSFSPDPNLPSGINFSNANNVRWTISGTNDIPSMSFICIEGFPTMSPMITSDAMIDRSKEFTVSTNMLINNADSVRFNIFAPNGYLFADIPAHNYSHTFDKSKLSLLTPGTGYVRITAYRTVQLQVNDKTIQYLNESVTTRKITIK